MGTMEEIPSLLSVKLLLKPVFDGSSGCQSLLIQLTFPKLDIIPSKDILRAIFEPNNGNSSVYDPRKPWASDSAGFFPIQRTRDDSGERYTAGRDVVGTLVIKYLISLSEFESISSFHKQEAGLILVGTWFLPRWVSGNATTQLVVEWDLQDTPAGNRTVCSFGEGPGPIFKTGAIETLLDCVYMFGAIKSDPPPISSKEAVPHASGTYWLAGLPPNLDCVTSYTSNIFPQMSEFFRDTQGSYRTFLRRVPQGLYGCTYHASSIINFGPETEYTHDYDLVRLLNHHMVASWVGLDGEADGTQNEWFGKGFAQLYSVFFPFRFKQRSPDYFRETLNCFLSAYYTNPLISVPLSEILKYRESTWHSNSAILMRSCIYMLKMDAYTRRSSREQGAGVLRPIDEIVGDIMQRRRRGDVLRASDWIAYLGRWLGHETALQHFQDFMGGKIIEMDDMESSFGDKDGPVLFEQPVIHMGFDIRSFQSGIIEGLEQGSRAERAGLKNGDIILSVDQPGTCELYPNKSLRMRIGRGGEAFDIDYSPRADKKVRVWQIKRLID